MSSINITFVTCFYDFKNKFSKDMYISWIENFLHHANNFNLVVFCGIKEKEILEKYVKNNIKLIVLELEDFYLYKYKDFFIHNHEKNYLLNNKVEWKVNMLWCEKVFFVNRVIENNYFDTEFYGWCDIGYFRNTKCHPNWPSTNKLNKDLILYNSVSSINRRIKRGNIIPPSQVSVCGGFFISGKDKCIWWKDIFEKKILYYKEKNYLIKDDQIIVLDCILDNRGDFNVVVNKDWFNMINYL